jgi:hypothetical protein
VIQQKVLAAVPEVNQAYQVLSIENSQERPKTHDESVKWIIQNARALGADLKTVKKYDANEAYSFAKINVLMKVFYQAIRTGSVTQADLDAQYEFQKVGYEIGVKLAALSATLNQ